MGWNLLVLTAGLMVLAAGGEILVRGASRLASRLGMSSLVIGLTVVALGTSAPEAAVSAFAALQGSYDVAVANIVGSNILNVLLVLGGCAVVVPLHVAPRLLRVEVPILIGASALLWLLAADGGISLWDSLLLTGGLAAYITFTVRLGRREALVVDEMDVVTRRRDGRHRNLPAALLLVAVGIVLLAVGARWLVAAAVTLARSAGLSDAVIGLTIVAVGTSLPEIAASLIAALRGERDLAVGNVLGSNLANILGIVGLSGLLSEGRLTVAPGMAAIDLPVMTAAALACLPLFLTHGRVDRWEGALFLLHYGAYLSYLVLAAAQHDALPVFSRTMLAFVLPLTAATLLAATVTYLGRGGVPADRPPGS